MEGAGLFVRLFVRNDVGLLPLPLPCGLFRVKTSARWLSVMVARSARAKRQPRPADGGNGCLVDMMNRLTIQENETTRVSERHALMMFSCSNTRFWGV